LVPIAPIDCLKIPVLDSSDNSKRIREVIKVKKRNEAGRLDFSRVTGLKLGSFLLQSNQLTGRGAVLSAVFLAKRSKKLKRNAQHAVKFISRTLEALRYSWLNMELL
jgi:hypothetical protein